MTHSILVVGDERRVNQNSHLSRSIRYNLIIFGHFDYIELERNNERIYCHLDGSASQRYMRVLGYESLVMIQIKQFSGIQEQTVSLQQVR